MCLSLRFLAILFSLGLTLAVTGCQNQSAVLTQVRVGYLPNITHAQALIGLARGDFQQAVGANVKVVGTQFNAGPAVMTALLSGSLDLAYVGPGPALNAYIKSNGTVLQIISGAASGGASLVVQPDLGAAIMLNQADGFQKLVGQKIASPQLGNTQDIALRDFLQQHNLTNQVQVVPIANADQLTLFKQKQIAGAWAPEPWATRLVHDAGGVVVQDERILWPSQQFATTLLVVRSQFLQQHPDVVKAWINAHVALTAWIQTHPQDTQTIINTQLAQTTGKPLDASVLATAWNNFTVTNDPLRDSVNTMAQHAASQGIIDQQKLNLTNLYNLTLLHDSTGQSY